MLHYCIRHYILLPSAIYMPRSFLFDASHIFFDISGENGLHWLV